MNQCNVILILMLNGMLKYLDQYLGYCTVFCGLLYIYVDKFFFFRFVVVMCCCLI
jgi:hypothetical protein